MPKVILRVQNERFAADSREMTGSNRASQVSDTSFSSGRWNRICHDACERKGIRVQCARKFPAEMEASIVLPAYSDGSNNPYLTGNEIRFGMDNGRISMNAPKNIQL